MLMLTLYDVYNIGHVSLVLKHASTANKSKLHT